MPTDNQEVPTRQPNSVSRYPSELRFLGVLPFILLALLLALDATRARQPAGWAIFAAALALIAWRLWICGLLVTGDAVVIRNLPRTFRLNFSEIEAVSFGPGRSPSNGWGYIHIRTTNGRDIRTTCAHRSPVEGGALAVAISTDLSTRVAGRA
jgi:hypothetical protein